MTTRHTPTTGSGSKRHGTHGRPPFPRRLYVSEKTRSAWDRLADQVCRSHTDREFGDLLEGLPVWESDLP